MAKQIFEGLKVADFSWAAAGPQVSRELAEHGATVVLIENHRHLSPLRTFAPYKDAKPGIDRSAFYAEYNTNKRCIALDITKPKGKETALKLVKWADIVAESMSPGPWLNWAGLRSLPQSESGSDLPQHFPAGTLKLVKWADIVAESMTPGTMAELGLDYESCRKVNPGVIYLSTSMQGAMALTTSSKAWATTSTPSAATPPPPDGRTATPPWYSAPIPTSSPRGTR